jgi:MutS-like protein
VNPRDTYRQRRARFEALRAQYASLDERLGALRLVAAGLIVVVIVLCLTGPRISLLWLVLPVGAFVALVMYHLSIRRKRAHAERAIAFYETRIARIDDRWIGTGSTGERFDAPHHVYAADLDLFGRGSLFELLSAARTRMGEEALARWLLAPASAETVRARQASIADLRDRLDLREDFALEGESGRTGVQPDALLQWAATPNELEGGHLVAASVLLPLLAVAGVVIAVVWGPITPFLVVLAVESLVLRALREKINRVIQSTESAFEDLRLFAALLMRIERETFSAPALRELVQRLSSHTLPASTTIGKLSTIVGFIEARRNIVLALLQVPLMYPLITALLAQRWRKAHGEAVAPWIEVLGEIEALLSMAAYAYEHPDDPLPELIEGPACFEARALGHPLIPAAQCVRNDVALCGDTRVLLVSGSNMSGKSTLLRTVGINTVLAMMGAPVRASSLRLTPLQVGASIRINDSLHEGSSRFYAEITRLKQLVLLMDDSLPLLFLLDELLQGTNSKDRRTGAEGIVRAFMERGAIGLISTHDLALTDFELPNAGALRNVHFEDAIVDGKMTFDFRLRNGVVTRSNGVELMRSIGLKV